MYDWMEGQDDDIYSLILSYDFLMVFIKLKKKLSTNSKRGT